MEKDCDQDKDEKSKQLWFWRGRVGGIKVLRVYRKGDRPLPSDEIWG